MRGKKILVTGASGFIGANLVRRLVSLESDVHVLVRDPAAAWRLTGVETNLNMHEGDLLDTQRVAEIVRRTKPAIVFHAAVGRPGTTDDYTTVLQTNVLGTHQLLSACDGIALERFVAFGSLLEYGQRDVPLSEDMTLKPTTFYGATKAAATMLIVQAALAGRVPGVVVRLFSVYGPWQGAGHLIPTTIVAGLEGQKLALTPPGITHEYVFVEDVIAACLRAATAPDVLGEVINIGSGVQTTNEEIVDLIGEILRRKIDVRVGEHPLRPTDTHYRVADIRKANSLLDWRPTVSLREGLSKTIDWFSRAQDLDRYIAKADHHNDR